MALKPFLKWAGGKRWLISRQEFELPSYSGRYIEPFLGGAALFFHHRPTCAILGDINAELIRTYEAIREDWKAVRRCLQRHQREHCHEYYYLERGRRRKSSSERAAQFIYLNRACWNGLYRVNLRGQFNVPIGTKDTILFPDDNFEATAAALRSAALYVADFATLIGVAKEGDLVFADPPYTTAHNFNGFNKYNDRIFSWDDQVRLKDSLMGARAKGATIVLTNAAHYSIKELYKDIVSPVEINRHSVISGTVDSRGKTSEYLFMVTP